MNDTTPWSEDLVTALSMWQTCGVVHPYTCGNEKCRDILIPTSSGFVCDSCDYTQKWCHAITTKDMRDMLRNHPFASPKEETNGQ
jgi:hypothetical protein